MNMYELNIFLIFNSSKLHTGRYVIHFTLKLLTFYINIVSQEAELGQQLRLCYNMCNFSLKVYVYRLKPQFKEKCFTRSFNDTLNVERYEFIKFALTLYKYFLSVLVSHNFKHIDQS